MQQNAGLSPDRLQVAAPLLKMSKGKKLHFNKRGIYGLRILKYISKKNVLVVNGMTGVSA